SGIGGGLIVNGEIYRGCGRGAAEIGHLRIATESGYGLLYRPLEELASGWAIQEEARLEAIVRRESDAQELIRLAQGDCDRIDARLGGQAAEQGASFAWDVLHPAWTCLAEAIAQVIALLCPRRIVIGGGVSLMGERVLFEPLRRLV